MKRVLTADIVVLNNAHLLLISRRHPPYQGMWALPGGKQLSEEERLEATAIRELREETGLCVELAHLHRIGVFATPGRDPRPGDYISTAYLTLLSEQPTVRAGDDAKEVRWFPLSDLPALAFDHAEIVRVACTMTRLDVPSGSEGASAQTLDRLLQMKASFPQPRTVCLCGSTRFAEAFHKANLSETLAGRIVLSIGCDLKSDHDLQLAGEITEADKERLDVLHLFKIDKADEILVLNVDGYVGQSTRREIDYARLHRKPIRWLEPPRGEEQK